MAKTTENNQWPLPKFNFSVTIDGHECFFTEISGLDAGTQVIEYRSGNSKQFSAIKMPGMQKFGYITMKRGIFKNDSKLWDWMKQVTMNNGKRVPVIIKLMDEEGKVIITWTLQNAFPVKAASMDLKADGNEVAIETLEIAHEGLTITNN